MDSVIYFLLLSLKLCQSSLYLNHNFPNHPLFHLHLNPNFPLKDNLLIFSSFSLISLSNRDFYSILLRRIQFLFSSFAWVNLKIENSKTHNHSIHWLHLPHRILYQLWRMHLHKNLRSSRSDRPQWRSLFLDLLFLLLEVGIL